MPRYFACFIFLGLAARVFGQAVAPATPPQVYYPGQVHDPPVVTAAFRAFFVEIMAVESLADKLKAQGKDDSTTRTAIQKAAKLTDSEASLLKAVAGQCNPDYDAEAARGRQVVTSLRQQYPGTTSVTAPSAVTQQLSALAAQRSAVISGCMQQLGAGMGSGRFGILRTYVLARVGSKQMHSSLPPDATFSAAPVPKH